MQHNKGREIRVCYVESLNLPCANGHMHDDYVRLTGGKIYAQLTAYVGLRYVYNALEIDYRKIDP